MKTPESIKMPADSAVQSDSGQAKEVAVFKLGQHQFALKCHRDLDAIEALESDWQALEKASPESFDYFQTFDWCYGWCQKFLAPDPENEADVPQVYSLYCDDRMVMVWPLVRTRSRSGLYFLEMMSEPLGQYSNVLFDPAFVDVEVGARVWSEIKASTDADAVALTHYPQSGLLADVIGEEGLEESTQFVSSILDFSQISSWEEYSASLSKNQRKERNRKAKKLKAQGDVTFEVHFYASEQFSRIVETAIRLKRKWLRETNRHSQALFEAESLLFLSSLGTWLPQYEPDEGPVAQVLKLDGEAIAIELGMLKNKHYYSYLGAIDLNWSSFAPGKVQIEMSQKWAFENGVEKFDFLSDPSDYKKSWTNSQVPMKTRFLPISAQGYFYCSLWKAQLKPVLRTIYQRSNPNIRKQVNRMLGLDRGKDHDTDLSASNG